MQLSQASCQCPVTPVKGEGWFGGGGVGAEVDGEVGSGQASMVVCGLGGGGTRLRAERKRSLSLKYV
jgi:hypothetical protein